MMVVMMMAMIDGENHDGDNGNDDGDIADCGFDGDDVMMVITATVITIRNFN